jgi:hypothetical protein
MELMEDAVDATEVSGYYHRVNTVKIKVYTQ